MSNATSSSAASSRARNLLRQVEIATPCSARWEDMNGNDRMRFCNLCSLHVYNLSAMTEQEAADLVLAREGRLCVRLFRRADGTVITEDCPRGLEVVRRRVRAVLGAAAGLLATVLGMEVLRGVGPAVTTGAPAPLRPRVTTQLNPPVVPAPSVPVMGEPIPIPSPPRPPVMGKVASPRAFMGDVAPSPPTHRR